MAKTLTPVAATPERKSLLTPFRFEFGDLLSRFFNGDQNGWLTEASAPAVDLAEEDNKFLLKMDVPGMEAKDINVQVKGNVVTISGERNEEKEEKGKSFHRLERRTGSFSRTLTLPSDVQENEAAAEYSQGVLTVTLPKCEKAKAAKIEVKS